MEARTDDVPDWEDRLTAALIRSLLGAMIGCLVTIPTSLFSLSATGGGHGTYVPAKFFHPYATHLFSLCKSFTTEVYWAVILPYPLYGSVIGLGGRRVGLAIVALAHALLAYWFWDFW